jgi:hypothetical protein
VGTMSKFCVRRKLIGGVVLGCESVGAKKLGASSAPKRRDCEREKVAENARVKLSY